jgi:serine/threonine protein phosphatase 1
LTVLHLDLTQYWRWIPFLPAGLRIYAVGDVHGRSDLIEHIFRAIDDDLARRPIVRPVCVFLGDYIDRGPKSREAIDDLISSARDREIVFLRGNHEAIAIKSLNDPTVFDNWMRRLGGIDTLISYGLDPKKFLGKNSIKRLQLAFNEVLQGAHWEFFGGLQNSFTCGSFFFAHAGVRPNVPLSAQAERDLLWIRDEFLSSETDFGKIVVHGHTPVEHEDLRANRINLDTGAFVTGRLSCLVIDQDALSILRTA